MILLFCGLSGSGKSSIANKMPKEVFHIIDGDTYRKNLCSDLGFSSNCFFILATSGCSMLLILISLIFY